MGYEIFKINFDDISKRVCLYDCIYNIEEADLLAQLAMSDKNDDELIIIMPGFNRGIKDCPNEYKKALELAEEYKYEE